jgi:tRNA pseudouridine13 synthase
VPAACEAALAQLEGNGIRVLRVARHGNKLRPGHLHGNRFRILIREADPTVDPSPILDRIRQQGLPNFYGPQRFGRDGETALLGMALLKRQATKVRNPFLRKLALSAAQSLLFNEFLTRRMTDRLLRTVLPGDVMAKWPAGGMFTADDVAVEQARFDRREIVPTGPMFGHKMFPAQHVAAEREAAILSEAGLSLESFAGFGKLLQGTRRHNLAFVDDLSAVTGEQGLILTFTLPAGSYATILLREVMKSDIGDE